MSFSINGFRSNLIGGGARPSLFEVSLNFPTLSPSSATTTTTDSAETTVIPSSKFLIKGASIPTSTIGTYDVNFHGKQIRIAGDRTFETWDTTIINDEGFEIRHKLEKWMDMIQNHTINTRSEELGTIHEGTNADYKKDLTISQYSQAGVHLRSYQFVGAFPSNLSAIALDWGTASEIEEYTCTWTYDDWMPGGNVPDPQSVSHHLFPFDQHS